MNNKVVLNKCTEGGDPVRFNTILHKCENNYLSIMLISINHWTNFDETDTDYNLRNDISYYLLQRK